MLNRNENNDEALRDAWQTYAEVYNESQKILGEYLDFIGGLSIRGRTLDKEIRDMAGVADEFVRICARQYMANEWLSFVTVTTRQEALNSAIARIIRLRFLGWTVWNLPLAAHELGHVVVEDDDSLRTFADDQAAGWSNDEQAKVWNKSYIHEVLADIFATYTIGPAYVCAAISLRLDPASDKNLNREYLADTERAHAMFAVLRVMNRDIQRRATKRPNGDQTGERVDLDEWGIGCLERQWNAALCRAMAVGGPLAENQASVGSGNCYEPDNERWVGLVDDALRKVRELLMPSGQYSRRGAAKGLEVANEWSNYWFDQLARLGDGEGRLDAPDIPPESTLRDALNAAWLCRIRSEQDKVDLIADAAYKLCKAIIETGDDATRPRGQYTTAGHVPDQVQSRRAHRQVR